MDFIVGKSKLSGTVSVPSSKSILQRFMIAGMFAEGITELNDVHHCSDTVSCIKAVEKLSGLMHHGSLTDMKITGTGGKINPATGAINCGESGFALRSLAAVTALSDKPHFLTGEGSLLNRPMGFIENVLKELNVDCKSADGYLPLEIKGPISFKDISIDGSLTSQFLSGLIMVYPFAKEEHSIHVHNLKSKFYVDLTIDVLKNFGIVIHNNDYMEFRIPGNQQYKACNAKMEGDWSAASFMLVAGAIAGDVTVDNISIDSLQPDKAILKVLEKAGATIGVDQLSISARKNNLDSFSFNATDCPDLFPPLVALAIHCSGRTEITGVERLIHKESNRALALQQEFSKMNDKLIEIEGNKMIIHGGMPLKKIIADSHNDHRIAMALAVAGLAIEGGITITGGESVEKSYPGFFSDLSSLIT